MDGARTDNDEEATPKISALDAGDDFMASIDDGGFGVFGLCKGESLCASLGGESNALGRFRAEGGSEGSMG